MLHNNCLRAAALGAALVALALSLVLPGRRRHTPPPAPRTVEEAVKVAEERGLYWRSDRRDGRIGFRVVVATAPVSYEQANLFSGVQPDLPRGQRTAAVYQHGDFPPDLPASAGVLAWGGVLVVGDPEVISKLTGVPAGSLSRPWTA